MSKKSWRSRFGAWWLVTWIGVGVAGCGATEEPYEPPAAIASELQEATFAGRFEDENTFVAIVTGSDAIRAYVCDGEDDVWFAGSALRLPALLVSEDGQELYLARDEEGLYGSLTRGDEELTFRAPQTEESALFRAETTIGRDHYLGGWIALPDGEQRGVLRENAVKRTSRLDGAVVVVEASRPLVSRLQPARFTPASLRRRVTNLPVDFNVVALGDSYGAGDGAPERTGNHGPDGVVNRAGEFSETWDVDATNDVPDYTESTPPLAGMSRESRPSYRRLAEACHRSGRNGFQVAADTLADEWPGVDVHRESFACSGSELEHVLESPYGGAAGTDALRGWELVPQLDQLDASLEADPRALDAVQISIGGNDMKFVPLMIGCALDPFCEGSESISSRLLRDGAAGVPAGYARLAEALDDRKLFPDDHVLLTGYPTPLRRASGGGTVPCTELGASGFEIPGEDAPVLFSDAEIAWADTVAVGTMNREVGNAARTHGWTFVDGHLARFREHGWCASEPWIGTLLSGRERQGMDAFGLGPFTLPTPLPPVTFDIRSGFSGGFAHPNLDGYEQGYGPAIAEDLRPILMERVRPTTPGDLRVVAQTSNGAITIRWDDRSTTETDFRVELLRFAGTGQGSGTVVHTAAATELRIAAAGRSTYEARVRACHTGEDGHESCSGTPRAIRFTNFPPTVVPSGLGARDGLCNRTCSPTRMVWQPVSDPTFAHLYYEVETFDASGNAVARFTTLDNFLEAGAADRFRVRSCNFTGCGSFSGAAAGPTLTDIRSDADNQLDTFCNGLRTEARVTGEPSLDPAGLCRGR
ncbi:MAG: hypothetical protein H6721_06530 [Sandaracinus sp.]|nr:hypothetical protein [Sandaracinus sp.]MCB9612757.1 hypothetical protein [Sandaracinus sp.]MCB9631778.1 hypothetical protein [Sandaracinus sp.]